MMNTDMDLVMQAALQQDDDDDEAFPYGNVPVCFS